MNQSILDFYGSMSEFELADLQASIWDGMMGTLAIFISVLFAYLAAAYYEGRKLSMYQAIAISSLYSMFQFIMIVFCWSGMGTVVEINYAMLGSDQSLMRVLLVAVLIVAWIISVVFMQQSRKS